jgi:hypothetical protein
MPSLFTSSHEPCRNRNRWCCRYRGNAISPCDLSITDEQPLNQGILSVFIIIQTFRLPMNVALRLGIVGDFDVSGIIETWKFRQERGVR